MYFRVLRSGTRFAYSRGVLMQLDEKELIEAVKEWCARRGITVTERNVMEFRATSGTNYATSKAGWKFSISIDRVDLPLKEGPYR